MLGTKPRGGADTEAVPRGLPRATDRFPPLAWVAGAAGPRPWQGSPGSRPLCGGSAPAPRAAVHGWEREEPRFTVTPEGPCPGDESEGGRSLRSRPVLDPGLSLTVPWGRVVGRPLGAVAAEHHAPCAQGRLGWQMVFRVFCHRKMNLKSDTEIQKVRKVVGRRTKIACENPAP